jgi:hypothetical protein
LKAAGQGFFRPWAEAATEACACLGLSLRDLRHGGLWWRSALLSVAATGLWLFIYHAWPAFFLRLSGGAALVSFAGLLALAGPVFPAAATSTIAGMGNIGPALVQSIGPLLQVAQLALVALAIAVVLHLMLFVFLVQTTIGLASRALLLERVRAIAGQRYPIVAPALAAERRATWACVKRWAMFLLLLCIPFVSLLLLLRFLLTCNLRWLHRGIPPATPVSSQQARAMLVLGVVLALAMLVPVLNLLVPGLMSGCVCHLRCRRDQARGAGPHMSHEIPAGDMA